MDTISPMDPIEINKNRLNSLSDFLVAPSARFKSTDTEAK